MNLSDRLPPPALAAERPVLRLLERPLRAAPVVVPPAPAWRQRLQRWAARILR